MNVMKKSLAALTLAATAVVASSPAAAREGYRDRDDTAAVAIGAGIVGLAVGAIVASSNRDRRYVDRRYDRRYVDNGRYYDNRYYNNRAPRYNSRYYSRRDDRRRYDDRYYGRRYDNRYYGHRGY